MPVMTTGSGSESAFSGARGVWKWTPAWKAWYRRLLPAYWIFLFCATHFPKLKLATRIPNTDKTLHFVSFGLLAFCYWKFAETFHRPLGAPFVWRTVVVLAVYAAVDEYLQQFVNRGADWVDWLADMVGAGCVLAVLEWRRRAQVARANQPRNPAKSGQLP